MPGTLDYVRALADDIGPRPATTDAEHRASEYLESVFRARGLEPEVQSFSSVRTYSWAYVIYHVLTIVCAVLAGPKFFDGALVWAAFGLSAIVAFLLWMDLDTRWGLTRIMPKGPSQNVIARHVPRTRRGERLRKVIVVAHYDTARASLAFAPGTVRQFPVTFLLMKWCTFLVPVVVLAMALPWTAPLEPWLWYAAMVVSAYLLVPLIINIHRELAMPFVDGANDNASGVAAMLGIMERIVPEPDVSSFGTGQFPAVRRDAAAAYDAGVVPEGAEVSYTRAGRGDTGPLTDLPDDFSWAEPVADAGAPRSSGVSQGVLDFDTVEFAAISDEQVAEARRATPAPTYAPDVLPPDIAEVEIEEAPQRKGLLGRFTGRRKERESAEAPREWLGVGDDFDARTEGRSIGSWDKFGDEGDDDDGFGWKGGWAGDDPIEDPEFAREEAARIRRRVTETVDRDLTEKEVWFVATGAEEVGTLGMQAFLDEFGDDVRDAFIINLDNVGAGQLYWVTAEGMAKRYPADRRLIGLAKRVSREIGVMIKPRVYKGLSTDATPALARGYKALSIMAFDSAGVPVNWHWRTDTTAAVEEELIDRTVELVTAMIREA